MICAVRLAIIPFGLLPMGAGKRNQVPQSLIPQPEAAPHHRSTLPARFDQPAKSGLERFEESDQIPLFLRG
jgi:hypothetical protein